MQLIFKKFDNISQFKGDLIEVRASGTDFVGREPDHFVLVDIPLKLMTGNKNYQDSWDLIIDYEIINLNLTLDGYRLKMFSTLVDSVNNGAVVKNKVENFINNWGGTVNSFGTNEVIFDISILNAFKTNNFWETKTLEGVIFNETNYSQETGVHTIEIDYNTIGNNPSYMENKAFRKGADIISHSNKILTVEITRNTVKTLFEEDLKDTAREIIKRRRYRLTPTVIDNIISQGGAVETVWDTFQSNIKDKVSE